MTTKSEAFSQEDLDEDDILFIHHSSQSTTSEKKTQKLAIYLQKVTILKYQMPNLESMQCFLTPTQVTTTI